MRVLFVSNLYPNPYHEHRAPWNRQQMAALAKRHPVHVINPIAWTDEWRWRRAMGRRLNAERCSRQEAVEVDHPRYYFPPRLGRDWYGACFRSSIARTFRSAVERFSPDVVLAAWAYPDGWAANVLSRRFGLPCFVKVHGSDVLLLDEVPARRRKTVQALREAAGVIAVSEDLKRNMVGLGVPADRITVVYDGVDTSRFHPGDKQQARVRLGLEVDEKAVLFVGNLVPVKGVDRLLTAVHRLNTGGDACRLHVIGDGPERPALTDQAEQLGISSRVCFHGAKPHADLPTWFQAADVFCLPSHSEGVPNVLLEAAACGTPFVAFDVGGISEIAHLGPSRLAPADEPQRLNEALAPFVAAAGQPERRPATDGFRSFDDSARDLEAVLLQQPCAEAVR